MWDPWLFPNTTEEWLNWLKGPALAVVIAVAAVFILRWLSRLFGRRVIGNAARSAAKLRGDNPDIAERRTATLQSTITWIITVIATIIAVFVGLSALGVNTATLLASAGVVGIVIGFGAQTLIRDVLNFVFIMTEHQFDVGDQVQVAGVKGTVMEITPRRTVLLDPDGTVHSVPNGAITVATNLTRALRHINLDVSVESGDDLDHVFAVLRSECAALAKEFPEALAAAPEVLRLDSLDDTAAVFNIVGTVDPAKHWEVTDQFQVRLKRRLEAEGIVLTRTAIAAS